MHVCLSHACGSFPPLLAQRPTTAESAAAIASDAGAKRNRGIRALGVDIPLASVLLRDEMLA